jgi:hypothetical protein
MIFAEAAAAVAGMIVRVAAASVESGGMPVARQGEIKPVARQGGIKPVAHPGGITPPAPLAERMPAS